MNPILVQTILTNIVIPELTAFFQRRREAGQPLPSAAEIEQQMHDIAGPILQAGEAFLRAKGAIQ